MTAAIRRDFIADLRDAFDPLEDRKEAEAVYAAMCNVEWLHDDGTRFATTWRMAGQYVADLRGEGEDYHDFYCSGNEGRISEAVAQAMASYGWEAKPL